MTIMYSTPDTKKVIDPGKQNKRARVARRMEDFEDETLKAIAVAKVPPGFAYLDTIELGD